MRDYELLRLVKEIEWLRTLAHVSPVAIFRADAQGRCTYINDRWSELTGTGAQAAYGGSWTVSIHPEDVERIRTEWNRCIEQRAPFRIEHRFVHPSGRIVWALTQAVREVDGNGQVTGYTGMATDITELHQMREELQRSHAELEIRIQDRAAELQRMARIVETIDDAVVSTDLEARVLTWNRGAEAIFGYTHAEMIGQPIHSLAPEEQKEEAHQLIAMVRRGDEIHRYETMSMTKAGAPIEIALSAFALHDAHGEMCGMWTIVRDITDRKRAERRLQRLSWRLLRVQDEERRRIARDLHDSTAQALAALTMNLAALAREAKPLSEQRRKQLLNDSLALAEQATSELRTTSYLLHPPLLDESGLLAALNWLANGFSERSGIEVKVEIVGDIERQPCEVETALFRVVQESLHNVHRHSGSEVVLIRLRMEGDDLVLEVRDRGNGVPQQLGDAIGVGISGMRERLLQLGGTLTIESNNPGTAVIARVPNL
jgi:PAS domain S-box-containing protein